MSALPNGWIAASLEEVAQVNPRLDKSEIDADLEVSFVPMPAVEAESGKIDVSAKRRFSEVEKGYTGFKENDVLFAKITPCMENGKMAVVPEVHGGLGFGSTEFHVLRPPEGIVPKYLYYFVSSKSFRMNAEHNMTGAVGQRRVPTTYFSQADIPLPPAAEQRRIVGKVEELFSELDEGVANLKQARAQLAMYRQALLKHAFEGHLTAAWRTKHAPDLESAAQLLARIRVQRESHYQKQMGDWEIASKAWDRNEASGKKPAKPFPPRPIEPLTSAELETLPKLPFGWTYLKIDDLCDVVRGGSPRPAGDPKYYEGSIPFLKVGDLTQKPGVYLDTYEHTIKEAGLHKTRLVQPPTLMISNSGATLGVPKICRIEATFNDGIAAFLGLEDSDQLYHYYFWEGKTQHLRGVDQGAAQPNLNTDLLRNYYIPICSKAEMVQVTDELDRQLSALANIEADIDLNLQKAEALRQSILKKAFAGELVPQDPADEPAAALLAGIRAEREAATARPKAKQAGKRPAKLT